MVILNNKQIRMLELLDEQFQNCVKCSLYTNGKCPPYWTIHSKYAIVGEGPGENEVYNREPFIGKAGRHLWSIMSEFGLKKQQFLIVNSVNCRPIDGNKNGKPTQPQQDACRMWLRKYIKVVKPEKILILGNYAMNTMIGESMGIMNLNGIKEFNNEFQANYVLSVHPSMCIYKGYDGKRMLRESIGIFKDI